MIFDSKYNNNNTPRLAENIKHKCINIFNIMQENGMTSADILSLENLTFTRKSI